MDNCEIKEHITVLSFNGTWRKEVNLVSWYGKEAKYDIRDWSKDYSSCGKGITLTKEEYEILSNLGTNINSKKEELEKKEEEQALLLDRIEALVTKLNEKVIEKNSDFNPNDEEFTEVKESSDIDTSETQTKTIKTLDEDISYESNLSFTELNKYFKNKYGRNFTELWSNTEKELYNSKDPLSEYSETGETDYFSGNENPADPFIWEKSGKQMPRVSQKGSGAYTPRKKR